MNGKEVTTADHVCAAIAMRLIDAVGIDPDAATGDSVDPEVNAHVRSCLRCFRTATELRETPRIAALLRQEQPADPGEFFWSELTQEIGKAWEQHHAAQVSLRTKLIRTVTAGVFGRAAAWIRRPIPAAMMGAAAAAILTLAVVRGSSHTPVSAVVPTQAPTETEDRFAEVPGTTDDVDPWDTLDLADLKSVVAQLSPDSNASASDDVPEASSSATDELEMLESDDLMAVANALGNRSRI